MSSTGNNKDMKLICVICNQKIDDKYGHNPKPVNGTGRCCTKCNFEIVIPRMDINVHPPTQSEIKYSKRAFHIPKGCSGIDVAVVADVADSAQID